MGGVREAQFPEKGVFELKPKGWQRHTWAQVIECAKPRLRGLKFRGQSTECEGERQLTKGLRSLDSGSRAMGRHSSFWQRGCDQVCVFKAITVLAA